MPEVCKAACQVCDIVCRVKFLCVYVWLDGRPSAPLVLFVYGPAIVGLTQLHNRNTGSGGPGAHNIC